jgi:hypothetical protein
VLEPSWGWITLRARPLDLRRPSAAIGAGQPSRARATAKLIGDLRRVVGQSTAPRLTMATLINREK